jgi:hypothetical protein
MRRTIIPLLALLALTACGGDKSPTPASAASQAPPTTPAPPSPTAATASHDSPDGAMAGLLEAMRSGDNTAVQAWLSPTPPSDRSSVTQVERMQSMLGLEGRLFWLVGERKIVDVETEGTTAEVELDGYIVWCTGSGPDDADASCAQPNGSGDEQTTTYDAVQVEGQWYVHLDLNRGELIKGNPGEAGVSG